MGWTVVAWGWHGSNLKRDLGAPAQIDHQIEITKLETCGMLVETWCMLVETWCMLMETWYIMVETGSMLVETGCMLVET